MTETVRRRNRQGGSTPEPANDTPATTPDSAPTKFDMGAGELGATLAQVGKTYGGHVARTASTRVAIKHAPTGIFSLDLALLGGIPEGLCSMLFGWESSGKTTVAMRTVARMQQKYPDMAAAFIDVEGTYDPGWGALHGVDNDRLVLVQPETGEVALDVAEAVVRSRETSVCVVDSLAALTPAREAEGSVGDNNVGGSGLLIGRFMRKVTSAMIGERKRDHWPTLVMVNQWRQKIGVMYGSPNTLPGGMAPKYFCSAMVEIKNKEKLGGADHDGVVLLNEHAFKVHKNKIGNSVREGEFQMTRSPMHALGQGFVDDGKTVVAWAKKHGVITGGGSSWRIDGLDEKFGKLDEIVAYFYSDVDFFDAFKMRLIAEQRVRMGKAGEGWH